MSEYIFGMTLKLKFDSPFSLTSYYFGVPRTFAYKIL